MNFWAFLRKNTSESEKDYLKQLFSIASADGHLDDNELAYITSMGKRLNFSEEEVVALQKCTETTRTTLRLPKHEEGRFFMLFSLINLILADDEVHPQEMKITESIVMRLGYDPDTVHTIIDTIQYNQSNGVSSEATYQRLKRYLA
ncbi:MAG: TerB family tellurite resistance protein [Tunicatimonas sp.]